MRRGDARSHRAPPRSDPHFPRCTGRARRRFHLWHVDVSVGHHVCPDFAPRHNLAVEAIRAERFDPVPIAASSVRHRPGDRAMLDCLCVTPQTQTAETTPDHAPGFPRLTAANHLSHDHAGEPIVLVREQPIYPPATLGVMLDVFA